MDKMKCVEKMLGTVQDNLFKSLADEVAEDIAFSIVASTINEETEQAKKDVADRYINIFTEKFNHYIAHFSQMSEPKLLKTLEARALKSMERSNA